MAKRTKDSTSTPPPSRGREIRFLVLFALLIGGGFTLLSLPIVNDNVVVPFTAGIARVSAVVLRLLGQGVELAGTEIHGSRFAVAIENGCNGIETMVIFVGAVLSFPAPWRARLIGLGIGIVAIQLLNLVRVVALFLTGSYLPSLFNSSHTVIWQSIVIAFGVFLWLFWAQRFALPRPKATS